MPQAIFLCKKKPNPSVIPADFKPESSRNTKQIHENIFQLCSFSIATSFGSGKVYSNNIANLNIKILYFRNLIYYN